MNIYSKNISKLFFSVVISGLIFCSCVSSREAVYFNNVPDQSLNVNPDEEQKIVPNDILSITVTSLNAEASLNFNNSSPTNPTVTPGYLVDKEGYIQFPVLGKLKVADFTKKQLTDNLRTSLIDKKLLIDPVVTIRYLNFRVTVLGEVLRPTVVLVPNEKISLLEALGMAGDLTIYARRDNVTLIRDENGKRLIKRINLNNADIFNSPYYYLRSNDIIYVEPNKTKISSSLPLRQNLPIVLSGLSLLAIIFTRINYR
ncbi:MAG: polysaccharide biosynthesis/export family protein [Ginsengibacter sp.]